MTRFIYATVIGAMTSLCCIVLSGKIIARLVYMSQHPTTRDSYEKVILYIKLIFYLVMCAISGLMIIGVQKKRHRLIGPWVIVGAVGVACGILNFFYSGYQQEASKVILNIVYIATFTLIWCPIYVLWAKMRSASSNMPQTSPGNPENHAADYTALP